MTLKSPWASTNSSPSSFMPSRQNWKRVAHSLPSTVEQSDAVLHLYDDSATQAGTPPSTCTPVRGRLAAGSELVAVSTAELSTTGDAELHASLVVQAEPEPRMLRLLLLLRLLLVPVRVPGQLQEA